MNSVKICSRNGCNNVVKHKNTSSKYCGDKCKKIVKNEKERIRYNLLDIKQKRRERQRRVKIKKECNICGKNFLAQRSGKYCCDECREVAKKKRNKERFKNWTEERFELHREKHRIRQVRKCGRDGCENIFNYSIRRKYCSNKCRIKVKYTRDQSRIKSLSGANLLKYKIKNKKASQKWSKNNPEKIRELSCFRNNFGTKSIPLEIRKKWAIIHLGKRCIGMAYPIEDKLKIPEIIKKINKGETHEAYK